MKACLRRILTWIKQELTFYKIWISEDQYKIRTLRLVSTWIIGVIWMPIGFGICFAGVTYSPWYFIQIVPTFVVCQLTIGHYYVKSTRRKYPETGAMKSGAVGVRNRDLTKIDN